MSGLGDLARLLAPGVSAAGPDQVVRIEPAVITNVVAGAAEDSTPLVTIRWRDTLVDVPYLQPPSTYSGSNVGQNVLIAVIGSQLLLLGRVLGRPPVA